MVTITLPTGETQTFTKVGTDIFVFYGVRRDFAAINKQWAGEAPDGYCEKCAGYATPGHSDECYTHRRA